MAKKRKKSIIPGMSYSWKRALGVTKAKQKIARATGIPTTRQGRQCKLGKAMSGGCLLPVLSFAIIFVGSITFLLFVIL